jgi:hypothetical protein
MIKWEQQLALARRAFAAELGADQVTLLPTSFTRDARYRLSKADAHWNVAGHALMAQYCYAGVQSRGLLPALELPDWPEANAVFEELHGAGLAEADAGFDEPSLPARRTIAPAIRFAALDAETAAQIHTGIDRERLVSPYASMILACAGRPRLRITGTALDRPELNGAEVEVLVDEFPAGSLTLQAGQPIAFTAEVPEGARSRPFVSLRLRASDYVYVGDRLRHLVTFRLEEVDLWWP